MIKQYNNLLSKTLNRPSLKDESFADYSGEVKYLGSWGGDFAMATAWQDESATRSYFRSKGIPLLYSYKDFIKDE